MYISPKHNITSFTFEHLQNQDFLIEIFEAKIDGWYLEVADRCINGWGEKGIQQINTVNRQEHKVNFIPDSGFAVLMIIFSYFETIGFFKCGQTGSYEKLTYGVNDVFPEFANHRINLARKLNGIRNDLYHMQVPANGFTLNGNSPSIEINDSNNTSANIVINPHLLIPRLRIHLKEYCDFLRDEKNEVYRTRFHRAFIDAYVTTTLNKNLLWALIHIAKPLP